MAPIESPNIQKILQSFYNFKFPSNANKGRNTANFKTFMRSYLKFINENSPPDPSLFKNSPKYERYLQIHNQYRNKSRRNLPKKTELFGATYIEITKDRALKILGDSRSEGAKINQKFLEEFTSFVVKNGKKRKREMVVSPVGPIILKKQKLNDGSVNNITRKEPPPNFIPINTKKVVKKAKKKKEKKEKISSQLWNSSQMLRKSKRKRTVKVQNVSDLENDVDPLLNTRPEQVKFTTLRNDERIENLEILNSVKNIYGKMLPNMPKDYTMRLVFDKHHISLVGFLKKNVVSGITFRPFYEQGFIEIAFVAVSTTYQIKGVGSRMMNYLKNYCQKLKLFRLLTCADNHAVGYFKKQGFSVNITLPKKRYAGYIKSYDSVTLMECFIRPGVDYVNFREILERQKKAVVDKLAKTATKGLKTYPGLECFQKTKGMSKRSKLNSISLADIPGLKEAGFTAPSFDEESINAMLRRILNYMKNIPPAWPFRKPVDGEAIVDYYKIIKNPMDLATMENNLDNGKYVKKVRKFHQDMLLIFKNCKIYNGPDSNYFKCADDCETRYFAYIKRSNVNLYFYF